MSPVQPSSGLPGVSSAPRASEDPLERARRLRDEINAIGASCPTLLGADLATLARKLVSPLAQLYDVINGTQLAKRLPEVVCCSREQEVSFARTEARAFMATARLPHHLRAELEPDLVQRLLSIDAPFKLLFPSRKVAICPHRMRLDQKNGDDLGRNLYEELIHDRQMHRFRHIREEIALTALAFRARLELEGAVPPEGSALSAGEIMDIRRTNAALRAWTEGEATYWCANARDVGFFPNARPGTAWTSETVERILAEPVGDPLRAGSPYVLGFAAFKLVHDHGRLNEFRATPWKTALLLQDDGTLRLKAGHPSLHTGALEGEIESVEELRAVLRSRVRTYRPLKARIKVTVPPLGSDARGCLTVS